MYSAARWALCGLVMLGAACSPGAPSQPVATQRLIPPTITNTPPPATDTATPLPASAATPTPEPEVLIPAGAQPLVRLAVDELSQQLATDASAIQLIRLEAVEWHGNDLGCADTTPAPDGQTTAGYRLMFLSNNTTYEYHTDSERVQLCTQDGMTVDDDLDNLLSSDPIAAELVALAQRRVADELDLPTRRVRLVEVSPVTWSDTSLGCPQPGTTYTALAIGGYRMVLEAGDSTYIFHSDFDRVMPCDPDDEVLDAEATAEATAE